MASPFSARFWAQVLVVWTMLLLLPRPGAADIRIDPPPPPVHFALKNTEKYYPYRFYCDTGDGDLHLLSDEKVYTVAGDVMPWTLLVYNRAEKTMFKWREVDRNTFRQVGANRLSLRFEITGVEPNKVTFREAILTGEQIKAARKRGDSPSGPLPLFSDDGNGPLQLGLLAASATALTLLVLAQRQRQKSWA